MSESSERFWTFVVVLIFVGFLLIATSRDSYGQQDTQCDSFEKITDGLLQMHGETPRAFATLDTNGAPIVVFTNPSTGTWTIIMLIGEGEGGCFLTSGTSWRESSQPKGKDL